jgi:hypothetical protein
MIRVISAIGALLVAVVGLVLSFGSIVAAPIGLWIVARRASRRGRAASSMARLIAAVLASTALAALVWSAVFALVPRPTTEELRAAAASQPRSTAKLPDWYTKAFPQMAPLDSASKEMVQSPGFVRATFILSAIFMAVFFGVLGGASAWGADALIRIVRRGVA